MEEKGEKEKEDKRKRRGQKEEEEEEEKSEFPQTEKYDFPYFQVMSSGSYTAHIEWFLAQGI